MEISSITDIIGSLITLTLLEVILGVDNLVFISLISNTLPKHQRKKARRVGLMFAWMTRLLLLAFALWLTHLVTPLFTVSGFEVSGRDIFLLAGGIFLLIKATQQIHHELQEPHEQHLKKKKTSFFMVIAQIGILDIIFSLDSIITAVGLTDRFWVMAIAITIAVIMMIIAAEPLSDFIEQHPTVRMLALSFLILIGTILIADGLHHHVKRGYIYFAIGFSLFVEWLNSMQRKKAAISEGS
jgi:predicted tellurium resistance membrane protein TerC